jgi:hypothetical protein
VLISASTVIYFLDILKPYNVSWKELAAPFVVGLYLLFAKDDDILAPLKAVINIFIKKNEAK